MILAEFVLGAIVGTVLGASVVVWASTTTWLVFGLWMTGACLNYVPLALYALSLSGPGRLEAELAGGSIERELRQYTKAQFWIAVPLLFVILAVRQERGRG